MAYNKIIYGENTLIDLTEDTVAPDKLLTGYTAHDKAGNSIVGTAAGIAGKIQTLEELKNNWNEESGFLLSYINATDGETFILNTINTSKGILTETTNKDLAPRWFLEQVSGYTDRFYIYTIINEDKQYIYNNTSSGANFIGLSSTSKGIFEIQYVSEFKFNFKISTGNKWLQHSNSGGGMRLWTDVNNANNSQISFTYDTNAIVPWGVLTITENGEYDISNYAKVIVNI